MRTRKSCVSTPRVQQPAPHLHQRLPQSPATHATALVTTPHTAQAHVRAPLQPLRILHCSPFLPPSEQPHLPVSPRPGHPQSRSPTHPHTHRRSPQRETCATPTRTTGCVIDLLAGTNTPVLSVEQLTLPQCTQPSASLPTSHVHPCHLSSAYATTV